VSLNIAGEIIQSVTATPPEYKNVRAAALAIFAVSNDHSMLPATAEPEMRLPDSGS
jgi:hypothetical protein